ncbi:MAG: biotin/lipoyl-containing protein [Balneolaceae bacterium]|nr:biotin/lipoyl-containing protein [Balneolaceae bacterium]
MKFETSSGDTTRELTFEPDEHRVQVDGESYEYAFEEKNGRHLLRIGTKLYRIDNVSYTKHTVEFTLNGSWCSVEVKDEQDLLLDRLGFKTAADIGEGQLNAPMPGKILEVIVAEGDVVELGDPVAILEAMKMENELKAPIKGVISTVAVSAGDSVDKNALILEIEASG